MCGVHQAALSELVAVAACVLLSVSGFATDIRVVGLDNAPARHRFAVRRHGTQPAQQVPAGSILNLQLPRPAHGADRLGAAQHQIHCEVANAERQMAAIA
jgi:hypothetical protein